MSKWRMTTADFKHLLEVEQNYMCALTGWDLIPATLMFTHKVPLNQGGKHILANTSLVHRKIVQLTRELSENEIIEMAAAVIRTRGKEYGLEIKSKKRLVTH